MPRTQILDDHSSLRGGWPGVFALIGCILAVIYCYRLFYASLDIDAVFDFAYGIIGFVLIIFLAFYKVRKSIYRTKLGTLQTWMQAHIYIGIISTVLVAMHAGFRAGGIFSALLLTLFLLTVFSGIAGAMIYNTIPVSVNKYGRGVLPLEEMEGKIAGYLGEADKSVEHAHDDFKKLYREKIRALFVHKGAKWSYLLSEERTILKKQKALFEKFKKMAPPQNIYDISMLNTLSMEKEKLAFMWIKLKMLRVWLNFHMPLSFAMITAAIAHIITVFYF